VQQANSAQQPVRPPMLAPFQNALTSGDMLLPRIGV
jgi:hypothetical protein